LALRAILEDEHGLNGTVSIVRDLTSLTTACYPAVGCLVEPSPARLVNNCAVARTETPMFRISD
jgi:hypothetical protein